jgi:hypothetical protein
LRRRVETALAFTLDTTPNPVAGRDLTVGATQTVLCSCRVMIHMMHNNNNLDSDMVSAEIARPRYAESIVADRLPANPAPCAQEPHRLMGDVKCVYSGAARP